jgi:acyl-CoA synthetase (AMP-forming)/AMP-acid ligase II
MSEAGLSLASIESAATELNVAGRLHHVAATMPDALAVVDAGRRSPGYRRQRRTKSGSTYATTTFAELDADVTRIARGLVDWGVPPGSRLALLVHPGIEFVTLVFALLRAGMVAVLIDAGMGRRNLLRCLSDVDPDGFVAIPTAQALRAVLRRRFPRAKWNVTVGRRWGWGGVTLNQLRIADFGLANRSFNPQSAIRNPQSTSADSPAAIIFTSGSTGPAKGVLYTHRMFDTQVSEIQSTYGIEPGGVDLACFPLFALFNSAMGVTTVLPDMNFSRPALADPRKLLTAANDWQVTQAFASPAVWRNLSRHCERTGERIESLRQVFSCGAPVTADVLRSTLAHVAPHAKMHTPYGATECLPVATIEASEVLGETAEKTDQGAGICVGRPFGSIEWRVIRISDEPIASIDAAEELPPGEIGELIVRGPQASPLYVTRTECNSLSKIADEAGPEDKETRRQGDNESSSASPCLPLSLSPCLSSPWHRMGDVGYLDDQGRFWYCGRKSQRVETAEGPLYTECVEAIINAHPAVGRSALVGVGKPDRKTPVIIVERAAGIRPKGLKGLELELRRYAGTHTLTQAIRHVFIHPELPVDPRHNAKINRESLVTWAAGEVKR